MKDEKLVKEQSQKYFDSTAKDYNASYDGKFVKCMYDEIVMRVLKKNPDTVLDLGCGNGNVLAKLADRTNAKLYGVDISTNMISAAKKRLGLKAELLVSDAENIKFRDNEFDVVICNASFHHYPNPQKVLQEIKRVLTSNGVLILGDPTGPSWYLKFLNWGLQWSKSGDFLIYSKKRIHKLLSENGFKASQWKKVGLKTFVINAEKANY